MEKNTKNKVIFAMYMAVSLLGIISAFLTTTILNFLLLIGVALFTLVSGIIILRDKGEERK